MRPLVLAALVACGGTPAAVPHARPAAAVAVMPDVPFAQLDHQQRIDFMRKTVVPAMKPLFQGHDRSKFAEFGCRTCHGADADRGVYALPNPALPHLDFHDLSEFDKADVEWMEKDIKPAMAKLLRRPEMSRTEPTGLGCEDCHAEK